MGYLDLEKYANKYSGEVPKGKIKLKGKEFKSDKVKITNVRIESSVGYQASTCYVELKSVEKPFQKKLFKTEFKLPGDFANIKSGIDIEISLGYQKDLDTVFKGFISSFDLVVDNTGVISLIVQGMDAKMWMMSSRKTELKKEKHKYSEIVSDTYKNYSSYMNKGTVKIKNETNFEADLYQQDESDYEFLCRIAFLTGCAFFINLGELNFFSLSSAKNSNFKIKSSCSKHIRNIKLSESVWGIPKSVEVFSIDKKDYTKVISAKATCSEKIGDGKEGTSITKNISNNNNIKIIDNTLSSVQEAKFLAEAIYNQRDMNLLSVDFKIFGYPKVELGKKVKVKEFGDPIDNEYIVTGIQHNCNFSKSFYETTIQLKSNRVNPQQKSFI